jgi:lipopolysaccharide transport system permease protein
MLCFLRNIVAQRGLIYHMVRREILSRYRASMLGLLWSVIQPLMMLAIYTFVFGHVMKSRWPVAGGDVPGMFSLLLFCGLLFHTLLSECLTRAPQLVVSQVNFVKKVVFPLEVLPIVMLSSALFHFMIGLVILLIAQLLILGAVMWTALLLPIIILPFALICLGSGWFLASLGVYVRDITHLVGLLTTVLLFFSPILYPSENLPEWIRPWMFLNPLAWPVETARNLLLTGTLPSLEGTFTYWIAALMIAIVGLAFFQKTRKGFADVL